MADDQPLTLPGHTVLSRLGRGGMATVWLAREEALSRLVAVKVIDQRLDDDRQLRVRFEREARTAASLSHSSIVPVYQYGMLDDGRPFMTMAFLEGGSLRDRLQRHGPCSVEEALAITRRVAGALQAAHARNVIHRDLKPDNVMFQGENALLMDFGIAKVMDASTNLTGAGVNPGTVRYFSPEQALGRPLDQRSDLYALGVMLYEMLTGLSPLEAKSSASYLYSIAFQVPAPLPAPLRGLQPLVDLLLAKDPADRLGSAGEVLAAVAAMERNWHRFESVDHVMEGVVLTPSGQHAPLVNLDELPRPGSSTELDVGLLLQSLQRTQTVPPSATGGQLSRTLALSAAGESRVGLLTLGLSPPDARVLLEFADAQGSVRREVWAGQPLSLPVGAVRLLAVAEGYQDLQRTVVVSPGNHTERLTLAPVTSAFNTGVPGAAVEPAQPPLVSRGAERRPHWLLALVALLTLIVAVAVYRGVGGTGSLGPGQTPGAPPADQTPIDPALKKALAVQFASLQSARTQFEQSLQALAELAKAERLGEPPERPQLDALSAEAGQLAAAGEFESAIARLRQARAAAQAAQLALLDRAFVAATTAAQTALTAKNAAAAREALNDAERLSARRAELAAAAGAAEP